MSSKNGSKQTKTEYKSSYADILDSFNALAQRYNYLSQSSLYSAFTRAGYGLQNQAEIQNKRVKAISTLPVDYSKADLGNFLVTPASSEQPLRQISQVLRWSNYPYLKIIKSYADMLTYRHFCAPVYVDETDTKTEDFKREIRLVDKLIKKLRPEEVGHKAAQEAGYEGKVFYTVRYNVDKSHNKVNYVFAQQLPSEWCKIIGFNNVSGYTISFNLMYFMQPGTDYTQYGDLFEPYMQDFSKVFQKPKGETQKRFVYAQEEKDGTLKVYRENLNEDGVGNPKMFMQNGRWMYYVSLPINKVWTFEIDDSTAIVASPFSGLLQTFAQQADFEAAQLSLIMNPLLKIFTGEIEFRDGVSEQKEDQFKLSIGARDLFNVFWDNLMSQSNTSGTAFYSAPVKNIKSHDFSESANANDISSSFLAYGMEKSGLTALIPATENPHQGVSEYSGKLESRYADRIYRTMEKIVNNMLESLNLKYEWRFVMFGSVYTDEVAKANALKELDKGNISMYYILAALNGQSIIDQIAMGNAIKTSGFLELLTPPQTSSTLGKQTEQKSKAVKTENGAPQKDETQIAETVVEKKTEGIIGGRN